MDDTCPINKYRRIHEGSSIAVLGSSPTLQLYKGNEDIAIAVNGALMGLRADLHVEYFMAGDKESHLRQWFLSSEEYAATRIVSSFVLPHDPVIIPDETERARLQRLLQEHIETNMHHIDFTLDDYVLNSRHGFFRYNRPWEQKISPNQEWFTKSSTISGVAAQMALVMGAKEIHLYGCSFGDVEGKHYSYDSRGEPGMIKPWQPINMDFLLMQIIRQDIQVYSHGPTHLRIPERVE